MNLSLLAVWARKIHRFLVLIVAVLGLIMMTTGYILHEAEEGKTTLPFIQTGPAGSIHYQISIIFAIILGVMIATGVFMYMYPWLTRISKKKTTE